jgi:hypothetical protein
VIGAWRELSGWDHPADPAGPEPAGDSPDKRAWWHAAFAALLAADGTDVRALPDGELHVLRDAYQAATAWAPPWSGDQLRQARRGAGDARLGAVRARADAAIAQRRGHRDAAARHEALAGSYQAMEQAYAQRETVLAGVMDDRREWEHATSGQRQLAVAADAELRRRNPRRRLDPLQSAEPGPLTAPEPQEQNLDPAGLDQWLAGITATRSTFAAQLAAREPARDLGPETVLPGWPGLRLPGPGWDAILQPPRPEIPPSARVIERVRERDAAMEAAP